MAGSVLWTDEAKYYLHLGKEFMAHQTVNHSEGEYVRNGASTNRAEGFFAQLKRSLDGTHHHVTAKKLPLYLAELDYKYNTRKVTDGARTVGAIKLVEGKRLMLRPPVSGRT